MLAKPYFLTCQVSSRHRSHISGSLDAAITVEYLSDWGFSEWAHMRRTVRTILNGLGVREVCEADDGASALESFTRYTPDIIIADWVMPMFSGIEMTRMIRQQSANANPYVPIIMLTAHSERSRVVEARDAGITEFLVKPISAKALYQRVFNVVMNPRPFIKTKTFFGPDRHRHVNPNYDGPERRGSGTSEVVQQTPLIQKTKVLTAGR